MKPTFYNTRKQANKWLNAYKEDHSNTTLRIMPLSHRIEAGGDRTEGGFVISNMHDADYIGLTAIGYSKPRRGTDGKNR